MVAPLMSVPAVGLLARPVATPAGAVTGEASPTATAFSDVLAAERGGGESLPQVPEPLPPAPGTGKDLPGAGPSPGQAEDMGVVAGAGDSELLAVPPAELPDAPVAPQTVDSQAVPAGPVLRADTSNEIAPRAAQDFPRASAQARARAADQSAVVSGLPAQALAGAGHRQAVQDDALAMPAPIPGAATGSGLDMGTGLQPFTVPPAPAQPPAAPLAAAGAQVDTAPLPGSAAADPEVEISVPAASAPGIQALMSAIQRDAGQPLPAAVRQALEAQQRRLDGASPLVPAVADVQGGGLAPAVAEPLAVAGLRVQGGAAVVPPPLASTELTAGPAPGMAPGLASGLAPGLSTGLPVDMTAEPPGGRPSTAEALARLASGAEAGADSGDESTLQATVLRTGAEGLRAGAGTAQLPAMPPGLAPGGAAGLPQGLSQGNAAWGQAISDRVLMMTAGNLQVAEIRLDPPELGALHIRLQLNQDQASLSFSSPHAQVREALEQQMPRLREMLAEQGFNLENSSVADDSRRHDRPAPESGAEAGLMAEMDEDSALPAASVVPVSSALVDDYA